MEKSLLSLLSNKQKIGIIGDEKNDKNDAGHGNQIVFFSNKRASFQMRVFFDIRSMHHEV